MAYERRDESGRTRTLARQGLRVAGTGTERAMAAVSHGAIAFGFVGIGFILSLVITASPASGRRTCRSNRTAPGATRSTSSWSTSS